MKVVVTAQGPSLESFVDPRFGRARYFVLADTESGEFSSHDNAQNLDALQGAGIQAAQTVARLGAQAVLTGHVGPKAFATLKAAKVLVFTSVTGTVAEAIDRVKAGNLRPAQTADVQGHWS